MTITITNDIEQRPRIKADNEGIPVEDLVMSILNSILDDPDDLSSDDIREIRAGISRGLQAGIEGRERPLNEYINDVKKRRSQSVNEAA